MVFEEDDTAHWPDDHSSYKRDQSMIISTSSMLDAEDMARINALKERRKQNQSFAGASSTQIDSNVEQKKAEILKTIENHVISSQLTSSIAHEGSYASPNNRLSHGQQVVSVHLTQSSLTPTPQDMSPVKRSHKR